MQGLLQQKPVTAIQALSQLYASDQALIQGDQANHKAKLAEGVTAETVKTVAGK